MAPGQPSAELDVEEDDERRGERVGDVGRDPGERKIELQREGEREADRSLNAVKGDETNEKADRDGPGRSHRTELPPAKPAPGFAQQAPYPFDTRPQRHLAIISRPGPFFGGVPFCCPVDAPPPILAPMTRSRLPRVFS